MAQEVDDSAIDTRSLSQRVYDYLAEEIMCGRFSYGDRLNIKAIARELNVSTMPIRDAMKRLEMENVVDVKPRSTCYIKVPTKKTVRDSIEARKFLEMYAVRTLYPSVPSEQLTGLAELVEQMNHELNDDSGETDLQRYIELDRLFHTELCELANNEYLGRFYREVNLHLNMQYRYGIGAPFNLQVSLADHREILEMLRQNSSRAVTILEEHLNRSRRNILSGSGYQSLAE
jgi:DNA-binding GntR family transcriptional regulator